MLCHTFPLVPRLYEFVVGLRPDGSAKGFAHIEFASQADAVKCFEAHQEEPLFIVGRTVRVDYAPQRNPVTTEPYHKLYIYDFPHDEQTLRELFKSYDSSILSVFMSTLFFHTASMYVYAHTTLQ